MEKLSSILSKLNILANSYGGIITLVPFLCAPVIWLRKFYQKRCQKNVEYRSLLDEVVNECKYNIKPGVGSPHCHFIIESTKKLLEHEQSNADLKNQLSEIISAARLCNAYGGVRSLKTPPGQVKQMFQKLMGQLK